MAGALCYVQAVWNHLEDLLKWALLELTPDSDSMGLGGDLTIYIWE